MAIVLPSPRNPSAAIQRWITASSSAGFSRAKTRAKLSAQGTPRGNAKTSTSQGWRTSQNSATSPTRRSAHHGKDGHHAHRGQRMHAIVSPRIADFTYEAQNGGGG